MSFEHSTRFRRQDGTLGRGILALEVIADLLHRHKLHALVFLEVLDQSEFRRARKTPLISITGTQSQGGMAKRRELYLSCISSTCGRPETSGWMVMGKTNSSYSR